MLHDTKQFVLKFYHMLDPVKHLLSFELKLLEKSYGLFELIINFIKIKSLKDIICKETSPGEAPIIRGDKYSVSQSPKTDVEKKSMKDNPYASSVGSLMHTQACSS